MSSATPGQRPSLFERLRRLAEGIAALMLFAMFLAFNLQVAFRYLFNWPLGWTSELSGILFLWLVLWGAAFVLRERDEIRFDVISAGVGRRARRVMGVIAALAVVVLYGLSLPDAWDYVSFMKVQESSYLDIRFDWLYAIFIVFTVAAIVRYLWLAWLWIRGSDPGDERGSASGI
jgi:TRAP-type C4-dicarboxylate transport system permease small subunit